LEKTISSKVLHEGRSFSFKVDEAELPDGRRVERDTVSHIGAVAIIPLAGEARIAFVRQYRYAAGEELLELPAGTLEKGESPDSCARRELREATGYTAGSMKKLLSCYMAPGYSTEVIHFSVASELTAGEQATEDDESIRVETYGFDEALAMIEEGEIRDAKTIVGVLSVLTR